MEIHNSPRLSSVFRAVRIFLAVLIMTFGNPELIWAEEGGYEIFRRTCATCHTVGDGRLVGPDLANVHNKRDEAWILKFVKSSQTLIKSGDAQAMQIFADFNNIPMPDQPLSEAEILKVLAYIAENSPVLEEQVAKQSTEVTPAEPELALLGDALLGQNSFVGLYRFSNGGPSCNSCHNVKNDAVLTGGILAKDLTEAYTRLTGAGIAAVLKNPPFPKMAVAYKGKSLTDEEIANLTEFLKVTEEQRIYQHSTDYSMLFTWAGIPAALTLMALFYFLWVNRRTRAVNHKIYKRQNQ